MEPAPTLTTWQTWLLAARPKTLPAAASPVLAAVGAAFGDGVFKPGPACAALLAAILLQVGANFANDVFDFHRGVDTDRRLGPLRVTQAGLLSSRQVLRGMLVVFGAATLLGLYLFLEAGWPVVWIGLASILAAVAYSGGPLPFGYYGLGDLVVFLFFGPVAVCGAYYVQARAVTPAAVLVSAPVGLLVTAILVVNNLRDIVTDEETGKRTLAVRIGVRGTRWQYTLCLAAAYLVPLMMIVSGLTAWWVLISWLSMPLAYKVNRVVWQQTGKALNAALAGTGQLALIFGVLLGLGLVLGRLLS